MNRDELLASPVQIGTRGSALALWQSNHVRDRLRAHWGDALQIELNIISTKGDQIQDRPLHEIGGKGLFVKSIEAKLLDRSVDLAVHSMKDMPALGPAGLEIACTPKREDPRDALVGREGETVTLAALPAGTRVGTGSLRRGAIVRRINPNVEVVPIRGNVPTRVGLVDKGEVDVVILAAAGLRRLGMGDRISEVLEEGAFLPAPAQGILALQCRADDSRIRELLSALVDADTTVRAAAERGFLVRLEASCTVPLACYATLSGDTVSVRGMVVDPSGEPCYEAAREGPRTDAAALGTALAEDLLAQGAGAIVERHSPNLGG